MWLKHVFVTSLCLHIAFAHTTQRPSRDEVDSNPLLDMASMFISEALNSQSGGNSGGGNSGSSGLGGVASLIGTLMQANNDASGRGSGSAGGAMQIISGIGSLLAANNGNGNSGGGFDPSIIGNVIEMFTNSDANDNGGGSRQRRETGKQQGGGGIGLDSILQIASMFMSSQQEPQNNHHQHKRSIHDNSVEQDNGLMSLLPMVVQAFSSFSGAEGKRTQERHKDHAWVLPPYLEHLHVLWDHFSNSDLADALYQKSGLNAIFMGFKGRDGKLDYNKLFESLNNQSFRRRWIKAATLYLADWAGYFANPDVYLKYIQTAQLMFNGFLKSQGYPKTTFFEPSRASETISNLLDYVAKHQLNVKIESKTYVKPAVGYAKELLKLGQARVMLQKFNATELSDKLTDTLNLEVIEPVLKVHRAYRYVTKTPHCDKYVLCELNSEPDQGEARNNNGGLVAGVKPKIIKVGSMGAALFLSAETGTPFWTLFSVITTANNCETKYPVDCSGFHEGEAKVTTEYVHNEL
ncbi:uncharacterized protein LOC129918265 [Episyrphus balteatus]|uniref:uncharacterized protein LOC129918265 n=1 Tax=Episyrphus balteatus TaxID=286459 RepID=UPI002484FDF9|nr:uncharacterized protein LOC129918265 [Episyrphus balteatus]